MRRVVAALVLLATTALGTGCLRADYGYELRADGSGVVELELRFREELVRTLQQLGLEDLTTGDLGVVEQQLDRLPEDWQERVDVTSLDDGSGVRIRIQVDDLSQLEELRSLGEIGIPQVTRRDDTWRVEVDFSDLVGAARALAPTADALTEGDLGSLLTDALAALGGEPEVVVRITMPGDITASDPSAQIDGAQATWTVTSGSTGVGFVESGTSPFGFLSTTVGGAPVWGLGLLALVVIAAAVAVVVARRRRRPGPATVGAPAPWEQPAAPVATWAPVPPVGGAPVPPVGGAPLGGWAPPGGSSPHAADITATLSVPEAVTAPVPVPATGADPVTEVVPLVTTAGWHPDPWGQAAWRWWDGTAWTHHTT